MSFPAEGGTNLPTSAQLQEAANALAATDRKINCSEVRATCD